MLRSRVRTLLGKFKRRLLGAVPADVNQLKEQAGTLGERVAILEYAVIALSETLAARTADTAGDLLPLRSLVCQASHFSSSWYLRWMAELTGDPSAPPYSHPATHVVLHRKNWEWAAILQAAHERGVLAPGKSALGFAVGHEPLPAMFAKYGVTVTATDLDTGDEKSRRWQESGQHADNVEALQNQKILSNKAFLERVSFRFADMNDLSDFPLASQDLVWSSCALEHLGDLERGLQFLINSARLLKVGGIGLHTTEFNLGSRTRTLDAGWTVIYRRSDLERAAAMLRADGFEVAPFVWDAGTLEADLRVDRPPYYQDPDVQHVKLLLGGHVSTSILLIVRRLR